MPASFAFLRDVPPLLKDILHPPELQAAPAVPSDAEIEVRKEAVEHARAHLETARTLLDPSLSPRLSIHAAGALALLALSLRWALRGCSGSTPEDDGLGGSTEEGPAKTPAGPLADVDPRTLELSRLALRASPETIARTDDFQLRRWVSASLSLVTHAVDAIDASERARNQLSARRTRAWVLRCLVAFSLIFAVGVGSWRLYVGPDLTRGRAWQTSSSYVGFNREEGYVDGNRAPLLFHTVQEPNPWAQVDFGAIKKIRRFKIDNRPDGFETRAIPLVVQASTDGTTWRELAVKREAFRHWAFQIPPTDARYVRVTVPGTTFLHLESVTIR